MLKQQRWRSDDCFNLDHGSQGGLRHHSVRSDKRGQANSAALPGLEADGLDGFRKLHDHALGSMARFAKDDSVYSA